MKKISLRFALISLISFSASIAASAVHAGDSDLCKSICVSEKKECRANADTQTKFDTDPMITASSGSRNPNDSNHDRLADTIRNKEVANKDFMNRKLERYRACDDKNLQCINTCTNTSSAPKK